jgi:hypothetical protein
LEWVNGYTEGTDRALEQLLDLHMLVDVDDVSSFFTTMYPWTNNGDLLQDIINALALDKEQF